MNKSIKITLLILAIVLAVGGVMWFLKTVVSPPGKMSFKTNHDAIAVNEAIDNFELTAKSGDAYGEYYAIMDLLRRTHSEGKITDAEYDAALTKFINLYTPFFASYAMGTFSNSEWPDTVLTYIDKRIDALRNVSTTTGVGLVAQNDANSELTHFRQVVKNYRDAQKHSRHTSFSSVDNARSTLAKAREYSSDPFLSNNAALTKALGDMPSKINSSHMTSLRNKLSAAKSYVYSNDFYTYLSKFNEALKEYNNNAMNLYGTVTSTSKLVSDAEDAETTHIRWTERSNAQYY